MKYLQNMRISQLIKLINISSHNNKMFEINLNSTYKRSVSRSASSEVIKKM